MPALGSASPVDRRADPARDPAWRHLGQVVPLAHIREPIRVRRLSAERRAVRVGEIAERAGLTKRPFFRHFTDKREVLFSGNGEFERLWLDAVRAAPPDSARSRPPRRASPHRGDVL